MRGIQSNGSGNAADLWSRYVCARSERLHMHPMGIAGVEAIAVDLLVIIAQLIKDLLGSLNPLRLFKRDYRASFREIWKRESIVLKLGYVVGIVGLLVLVGVLVLFAWHFYK